MALRQQPGGSQWVEPKGTAVGATMGEVHIVSNGSGGLKFEPVSEGNPRLAQFLDFHGDRTRYRLVLTSAPWVIIDVAGKLQFAASGTPAAILMDNGAGGLRLTADLTQTPAGAVYEDVRGRLIVARFDCWKLGFVLLGTTIRPFETT